MTEEEEEGGSLAPHGRRAHNRKQSQSAEMKRMFWRLERRLLTDADENQAAASLINATPPPHTCHLC